MIMIRSEFHMSARPNILFLMSDEHRADVTGYEGNSIIRTPVLDELARTGQVFRNAYTPSPVCIPARQSMAAGQFPRHCGCERYGQDLAPGYMTFARRLAEYGYETVVSGKLSHMGTDQMQGWTTRISGDMHIFPHFRGEKAQHYRKTFASQKWNDVKEIARAGVGKALMLLKMNTPCKAPFNLLRIIFAVPIMTGNNITPCC
jgi:choline-sulfatase